MNHFGMKAIYLDPKVLIHFLLERLFQTWKIKHLA